MYSPSRLIPALLAISLMPRARYVADDRHDQRRIADLKRIFQIRLLRLNRAESLGRIPEHGFNFHP